MAKGLCSTCYSVEYHKKDKDKWNAYNNRRVKEKHGSYLEYALKLNPKKLLKKSKKYLSPDVAEAFVYGGVLLDTELKKKGLNDLK